MVQEALDKPRNIHFKGVTDLVTDTDSASEEAVLKVTSCCAWRRVVQHLQHIVGQTRSMVLCGDCSCLITGASCSSAGSWLLR